MRANLFFKMFTNCIVTNGANRSIILDLQNDIFTYIPDSMGEIINEFIIKKSIKEIYNIYGIENKEVIDEYIDFLIKNDFGFLGNSDDFDRFIEMDKTFDYPSIISNCIIEYSTSNLFFIDKITNNLKHLFCENLQIICYERIELKDLIILLEKIDSTIFRSIELILNYSDEILKFIPLIKKYNVRITEITFHNSVKDYNIEESNIKINFIHHEINAFFHCGIIDSKYFNLNRDKVLESLNHNSCLNRKISIDKDGNIKNCPSMPESFGNIKNTTLQEALSNPTFKKYWNITKDQIEVCKDCEFRHICTDCRAFVEEPNNQFSKPLKCGYNPYTNIWEEWSTNPLKQKSIEYYGLQDLIKK
jgi:SPASM domain peptide maturase of grasp-with-spasm system